MLEAGSVRTTAYSNIIFKNFIDAAIAGICFWAFGYAIAYGNGNDNGSAEAFWGSGDYFLSDLGKDRTFASYESWFFQYTFAATAATIVSGCIAELAKLMGYVAISIILTTFTYPVVVHWVWDSHGWLSAFNADARKALGTDDKGSYGVIDFAGSGVVHMVGGLAGLVGAAIIGGRVIFREDGTYYNPMFETKDGKKHPMFGIKARLLSAYLPLEEQVEKTGRSAPEGRAEAAAPKEKAAAEKTAATAPRGAAAAAEEPAKTEPAAPTAPAAAPPAARPPAARDTRDREIRRRLAAADEPLLNSGNYDDPQLRNSSLLRVVH